MWREQKGDHHKKPGGDGDFFLERTKWGGDKREGVQDNKGAIELWARGRFLFAPERKDKMEETRDEKGERHKIGRL